MSQKTLRQIQAQVNFLRMRVQRLSQGIEVDVAMTIPHLDPDGIGGPEEAAKRLRAAWRIPIGPVGNVVNAIECAGGVIVRHDFKTHRINAISVWHPGSPALFVVNATLTPEQQRFVLAHELGHMVMHEGEPPRDDAEREADRFAEEFLMPAAEVASDLRSIDLKRAAVLKPYWKVSMQSLIIRAEHLGIITQARCRSLHAYMNKLGYLSAEPFPVPREDPTVLNDIVQVHLDDHDYTPDELAKVLGMKRTQFMDEFTTRKNRLLRAVN